jgi:hypothetical protein
VNAYFAGGAALLWLASIGGAYAYRAHQDAGAVEAAQTSDALESARMVQVSMAAGEKITQAAQDASDMRSASLEAQINQSRSAYANLPKIHVSACPVPIGDVGMLVGPANAGSSSVAANPGAAPANPQPGSVDAGAIILACEVNRGAFDRNLSRLDACISAYDAARAEVNSGPPKAP